MIWSPETFNQFSFLEPVGVLSLQADSINRRINGSAKVLGFNVDGVFGNG